MYLGNIRRDWDLVCTGLGWCQDYSYYAEQFTGIRACNTLYSADSDAYHSLDHERVRQII